MTVYRSKARRAAARSFGHLRRAQEEMAQGNPEAFELHSTKAMHAIQIGNLHEKSRIADAAEARTIIELLNADPESDAGSLIGDEDAALLGARLVDWARAISVPVEETEDDE